MQRKSFLYRNMIIAILSIWALIIPIVGKATDVSTKDELVAAIGRGEPYIKLTTRIDLGNTTLTINSGTITLDLNGNELSMAASSEQNGICMNVKGGDLTIVGGGILSAKGGKGKKPIWGNGSQGKPAYAIQLTGGTLKMYNTTLKTIGGDGGDGSFGYSPGAQGDALPIKSNNSIDNMIPKGYAIKWDGTFLEKYNVNELKVSSASSTASVEFVNYKLSYDLVGGTNPANVLISYTIETKELSLPNPIKEGYNFDSWYYEGGEKADLASLLQRATSNPYERKLTAHWIPIEYTITYNMNGGINSSGNPENYTIESEIALKDPSRSGYQFMGWYDNASFNGNKRTTIPKGSMEAKALYAKWSAIYTIKYNSGESIDMPSGDKMTYIVEETPFDLQKLTPPDKSYTFMGWCTKSDLTDAPVLSLSKGATGNKEYYAKWNKTYYITYHWLVPKDKETMEPMVDKNVSYTKDDEVTLLTPKNGGYQVAGWYDNAELGDNPVSPVISKGTERNFDFYAKWKPIEYSIDFKTYHGSFPTGVVVPKVYTYESESISFVRPVREGYTFTGWFADAELTQSVTSIVPKSMGNKTFYANWTLGNVVSITQPANGTIVVKSGTMEIKHNGKVGTGVALHISVTPDSSIYKLAKLIIGDNYYTSASVDTIMPSEKGLSISAEFVDPRPTATLPQIVTDPVNTDYIPAGGNVTVTLKKKDNSTALYYSIDGTTPKAYTQPFLVSSLEANKTLKVSAISRKDGHKDGITTRDIKFGSGKITISLNLPKGITATNPLGGEVVSAVASGGTFQFKLNVDEDYFVTLDSLRVEANGTVIKPDVWGVFTLSEQKANVTVKVAGITGTTYTIALTQKPHGRIFFTDNDSTSTLIANRGDRISVTAEADEDYKFVSWTDGNQSNPREIIAESNINLQANFVTDADHYVVIFPIMEGVTVKTLTNYSQQVKQGEACKFYLRLDADYNQSVPVVRANGEVLTVNKEVYSLFNIKNNYSISVSGIRKNKTTVKVAENVSVTDVETTTDATKLELLPEAVVNMYAKAPAGKVFLKWNDGKADNPRLSTAQDAPQLIPLFTTLASGDTFGKVTFSTPVGAGVSAINANADAVKQGDDLQFKVVILPQYSQSKVKVTADNKEIQPELELRASTAATSFIYTLKSITGETKVKVSALELNKYTLAVEQTEGGVVRTSQSGTLAYGTGVTLSATPTKGNMFVKWSDGNTLNPYPYKVTKDITLHAVFTQTSSPVDIEGTPSLGRMYMEGDMLHIEVDKPTTMSIWNYSGQLVQQATIQAGHTTYQLSQGSYIVKTGMDQPIKVIVR